MSFEAITAPSLMIGTHSHFVAPVDLSTFRAGLPANRRIVVFQPLLDRLRILLVGATQRFLRCKSPPLQVAADGPDRNRNTVALFDQLADSIARPQAKGSFNWSGHRSVIKRTIGSRLDDRPDEIDAWDRVCVPSGLHRRLFDVHVEPIVNRRASHSQKYDRLRSETFASFENRMNDPIPQFLLRLRRKLSAIVCFHKSSYDLIIIYVQ